MKPAIIALTTVTIVTIACTPPGIGGYDARPRNPAAMFAKQGAGFGPELLRTMTGFTALDALRMLPAYYARVNQRPAPTFVLVIDGARTSYLDMLSSIQATDLLEIRVVNQSHTTATGGEAEIIVTTVGGRKNGR
jgi:hypothetical protein